MFRQEDFNIVKLALENRTVVFDYQGKLIVIEDINYDYNGDTVRLSFENDNDNRSEFYNPTDGISDFYNPKEISIGNFKSLVRLV